jgi:aerobic-type carbon monoxide dehydrogenase small subunit (CoxS/CutS family)
VVAGGAMVPIAMVPIAMSMPSDATAQPAARDGASPTVSVNVTVNGTRHALALDPRSTLLDVLREHLDLTGSKKGCDQGQCGACTVLIDGKAIRSCVTPVSAVNGAVETIEGLGTLEKLHPLQKAFIEEQACQCGYCGNGMVMSAKALLARNPRPTNDDIRKALNGHLCRCASHNRIVRAVQRAAKEMQS